MSQAVVLVNKNLSMASSKHRPTRALLLLMTGVVVAMLRLRGAHVVQSCGVVLCWL